MAWVVGGHWLDAPCPLILDLEEISEEEGRARIAMKIPDGLLKASLEVEIKSGLPRRLTWRVRGDASYILFKDYRKVEGAFLFPHRTELCLEQNMIESRVRTVKEAHAGAGELCKPVTRRPADVRFDRSKPACVEMKQLPSGHLIVRPLVDEEDMGWFLFDTGAGMSLVDHSVAERLGMKKIGMITVPGGGGEATLHFRKGKSIALGPVEVSEPFYLEWDCAGFGRGLGVELGGILGYELISRCLVELDIRQEKLALFEPGTWDDRNVEWKELTFYGKDVALPGRLACGRQGMFVLDTGAGGATATFCKPFVSRKELFGKDGYRTGAIGGVGGDMKQYYGRTAWFEFCGHRFDRPHVELIDADEGFFSDAALGGLVGNALLARFKLLIDYPNKRIALLKQG
jgi:hypothetical protein